MSTRFDVIRTWLNSNAVERAASFSSYEEARQYLADKHALQAAHPEHFPESKLSTAGDSLFIKVKTGAGNSCSISYLSIVPMEVAS